MTVCGEKRPVCRLCAEISHGFVHFAIVMVSLWHALFRVQLQKNVAAVTIIAVKQLPGQELECASFSVASRLRKGMEKMLT